MSLWVRIGRRQFFGLNRSFSFILYLPIISCVIGESKTLRFKIRPWRNEISAILDASKKYKLYHYRDRLQREIDFLIERLTDDAIVGVEVKASATARKEDFKHLAWFRDNEAKGRKFQGVVLYSGNEILSFGPSLTAVPFNVMWTENAV